MELSNSAQAGEMVSACRNLLKTRRHTRYLQMLLQYFSEVYVKARNLEIEAIRDRLPWFVPSK